MRSLSPLDQLAVEAFVTALETCRETGVELPDDVWAIAQSPEQHLTSLSEIAQQHPQLNTAYRTARKLLRQAESDRQKRLNTHDHAQVGPGHPSPDLLPPSPSLPGEPKVKTVRLDHIPTPPSPPADTPSPDIQRIVLAANASDRDRQNYQKYLEELQRLNPDWAIVPDCPQAGEADAHLAIWKDQDYLARHAAYIATRYLNEFFRELSL